MARTSLLRWVNTQLCRALADSGLPRRSRRQFLKAAAATGGVLAASLAGAPLARAQVRKQTSRKDDVIIIGAGLAGLTCAWTLVKAGYKPTLYESRARLGGRVLTKRDFNADGQFAEMGAELVDSNHDDLRGLCKELGVRLQSLAVGETGDDVFYFGGTAYTPRDLVGGSKPHKAFMPLAKRLAKDYADSFDSDDEWTARGRALDQIPLHDYIEQARGQVPDWVLTFLHLAYETEYGLPTREQSALNLILLLGATAEKAPFSLYGESDELYRIAGGSSALVEALERKLDGRVDIRHGHALKRLFVSSEAIDGALGRVGSEFATADNAAVPAEADRVVLALPFTRLRQVEGMEALGLAADKLRAIRELGYGTNAKLLLGTKSRPWRQGKGMMDKASNGAVFSDLPFQTCWEGSRKQPGASGLLVNFLGGPAGKEEEAQRLSTARRDLEVLCPALKDQWDDAAVASAFWARDAHALASYTCPAPGQVTGLLPHCGTPELKNRLFFAGEHTSEDFNGYMNGAVESGLRAAKEILEV